MSALIRTLSFVGDLGDDFYRDEYQRDVWNEASAVGFQFLWWTSLVAAAILPVAAGRTGAWVALGLLIAWLLGSAATLTYARARGVDPGATESWLRPRVVLALTLYLVAALGTMSVLFLDNDPETWAGAAVGAVVGGTAAGWAVHRRRRRRARRELADEDL